MTKNDNLQKMKFSIFAVNINGNPPERMKKKKKKKDVSPGRGVKYYEYIKEWRVAANGDTKI